MKSIKKLYLKSYSMQAREKTKNCINKNCKPIVTSLNLKPNF